MMAFGGEKKPEPKNVYVSSFLAGGMAGMVVDFVLFPLDTIKTRLQAEQGFIKSGGFKGVYKGIGPQAIGSAPQGALFFLTYESVKHYLEPVVSPKMLPFLYMFAGSLGEVVACLIRVPMEVVKQRRQISTSAKETSLKILMRAYRNEGFVKGLYRGYGSTVLREIPFSIIQFPILELSKKYYRKNFKNNIPLESYEVALCGAFAGGISAGITTPMDVVKTRIMLADRKLANTKALYIRNMFRTIYKEKGLKGLFAGFVPRVMWITLGGYIFFGTYDFSKNWCEYYVLEIDSDVFI